MSDIRNKRITIRFSGEEYDNLMIKAQNNNMEFATYVRERIFFDALKIEENSFEFKVIKATSFLTAVVQTYLKSMPAVNQLAFDKEIKRVMIENGIPESQITKS
jgi:hypothetical protein